MQLEIEAKEEITFNEFKQSCLEDFKMLCLSRETSLLGRREVLSGKAKFGIFGDGKELPQIAMAKVFRPGDFRSGYYRDQTFMFAIGELEISQFFAQLYAHTDLEAEPASGGRQMTSHFATHFTDENGNWLDLSKRKNVTSDISPTAGQMPRLLGLALASNIYAEHPEMDPENKFTNNGNEVAFGTIGDASTSEGLFWETINAAGVLQVPMILSIWDDGYGISVPGEYQYTKSSISEMLSGFQRTETERGYEIFRVKAWDYAELIRVYQKAEIVAREEKVPVIVHVTECTQPQGHSTSGSHERYKSEERLAWELEFDGLNKFKQWLLEFDASGLKLATAEELDEIQKEAKKTVRQAQKKAWNDYNAPIKELQKEAVQKLKELAQNSSNKVFIEQEIKKIKSIALPFKRDIFPVLQSALRLIRNEDFQGKENYKVWLNDVLSKEASLYNTHLWNEGSTSYKNVDFKAVEYAENPEEVDGSVVLRNNFMALFEKYPNLVTFGEDTGKIGDVNQGLRGLQDMFGKVRVSDTGIREATIIGQGIGLGMRGLRPIAEIQYLDYLLYGLQVVSDDLATLNYRSVGRQKSPCIIRTRGHRLEGIWHAGSHIGAILHLTRGLVVAAPRGFVQAAGIYNSLLQCEEPAIVIEPLNAYRLKEKMPSNLGEFTTPIGEVEITKEGADVTLVCYGSTWRIATKAAEELQKMDIDVEVIDVQFLSPFDETQKIQESLKKTNRLVIVDEDVPGGASAYMLNKILVERNGYYLLDSKPLTITAKDHRPAYATDGDYFSKPSAEDIINGVYQMMHESQADKFPKLF